MWYLIGLRDSIGRIELHTIKTDAIEQLIKEYCVKENLKLEFCIALYNIETKDQISFAANAIDKFINPVKS